MPDNKRGPSCVRLRARSESKPPPPSSRPQLLAPPLAGFYLRGQPSHDSALDGHMHRHTHTCMRCVQTQDDTSSLHPFAGVWGVFCGLRSHGFSVFFFYRLLFLFDVCKIGAPQMLVEPALLPSLRRCMPETEGMHV